jgi:hypothetical protein
MSTPALRGAIRRGGEGAIWPESEERGCRCGTSPSTSNKAMGLNPACPKGCGGVRPGFVAGPGQCPALPALPRPAGVRAALAARPMGIAPPTARKGRERSSLMIFRHEYIVGCCCSCGAEAANPRRVATPPASTPAQIRNDPRDSLSRARLPSAAGRTRTPKRK